MPLLAGSNPEVSGGTWRWRRHSIPLVLCLFFFSIFVWVCVLCDSGDARKTWPYTSPRKARRVPSWTARTYAVAIPHVEIFVLVLIQASKSQTVEHFKAIYYRPKIFLLLLVYISTPSLSPPPSSSPLSFVDPLASTGAAINVPTAASVASPVTADLSTTLMDAVGGSYHDAGPSHSAGVSLGPTPQWGSDSSAPVPTPPLSPPPASSVASSACPTDERGRPLCRRARKSLKRRLEEVERDLHDNLSLPSWSWSFEPVWLGLIGLHVLFAMEKVFLALEDEVVKRNWAMEEEGSMRPSTWAKKWRIFKFRLKGFVQRVGKPVLVLVLCITVVLSFALETVARGGQGGWRDVPFGWAFGQEEGEGRLGLTSPARLLVGIEVRIHVPNLLCLAVTDTFPTPRSSVPCGVGHRCATSQTTASASCSPSVFCCRHFAYTSTVARGLAPFDYEPIGQED
jgi:hypothetical protein